MIEASRFCLAPEHRGLRTAREFVLAMVCTMQPLGFEHGIFDVRPEQALFYRLAGFDQLGQQVAYRTPMLGTDMSIFKYDFRTLIGRNQHLLGRMGFNQAMESRTAA
jgi:hypothetical protein